MAGRPLTPISRNYRGARRKLRVPTEMLLSFSVSDESGRVDISTRLTVRGWACVVVPVRIGRIVLIPTTWLTSKRSRCVGLPHQRVRLAPRERCSARQLHTSGMAKYLLLRRCQSNRRLTRREPPHIPRTKLRLRGRELSGGDVHSGRNLARVVVDRWLRLRPCCSALCLSGVGTWRVTRRHVLIESFGLINSDERSLFILNEPGWYDRRLALRLRTPGLVDVRSSRWIRWVRYVCL